MSILSALLRTLPFTKSKQDSENKRNSVSYRDEKGAPMLEYFEVIDRNESEPAIPEGNSFDLPQLREIGGGGWGHVFKVEFNSPCALKLYDGRAGEGRLMESAKVEYQALVAMGGAGGHAPKAYARGRALHDGVTRPAVIMEFVEGAPLADPRGRINPVLLEYGKAALGAEAALEAAERVAQALQACHEAGRVNRDLWPANVMVGYDEASRSVSSASIVDWGQAPRGDGHGVTPPNEHPRLAQLNFAAPEVYGGDHRDRRDGATVDVWSLGAIAFWLRTGKAPLGEELRGLRVTEDTMDEVAQIKREHPLDLAAWLERYGEEAGPLDRGLSDLILRCTSYDPSRRPEGPGEVAGEIRGLLAPEVLEPTPGLKVPVHTPGLKVPEPTPGSFWSADVAVCDVRNVPAPSNVHTPVGPEAADAARQQAQWRRDAGAGYHRRIEQEQQTQEQAEHLGDMAELLERLGAQLREPQRREALRRLRDVLLAAGTEHMAPGLPDECRRGAEECKSWLRRADEASDRCGRRAEGLRALAGQARGGRAPAGGGEGALEQAGGELEAGKALLRERPGRSSLGKLARELTEIDTNLHYGERWLVDKERASIVKSHLDADQEISEEIRSLKEELEPTLGMIMDIRDGIEFEFKRDAIMQLAYIYGKLMRFSLDGSENERLKNSWKNLCIEAGEGLLLLGAQLLDSEGNKLVPADMNYPLVQQGGHIRQGIKVQYKASVVLQIDAS